MNDFLSEALAQMRADGLIIDLPILDGELHRCPVDGKEKARDGAYIIHADKNPVAWWQNWKTGAEGVYSEKSQDALTAKERKERAAFIKLCKQNAAKKREFGYKVGAKAAIALWNSGKPATDNHPYLKAKQAAPIGLRVDNHNNLLIPVMDADGKIMSVQKIPASKIEGEWKKFFVSGGKTSGGFYPLVAKDGAKDGPLLIGEGYATVFSCHAATGYACLVAFNSNNLKNVATLARQLSPTRKICLPADYDNPSDHYAELGGVGVAKARDAAIAIGGYLAICPPIDGGKADFNDIAARDGLDRVRDVIEKALAGEPANACPMPDGYFVKTGRNAGLYYRKETADGAIDEIRLGPPLEVIAETRDADSMDWGLYLRWLDNDDKEHKWAMPKTLLYSQHGEWFARLAYGGWCGNPSCRKYIGAFLADVRPIRRVRCVDKTGWHGDSYVLPDMVYGKSEAEDIVLQSTCHNGLYQTGGTLDGWQEIARLCVGNSRLSFALSCAFAGPLLKLAGLEGGAFSFEGGSSCGKTTALNVAASVWGSKEHVRGWRVTDNGLEGAAALHNDNLLILDELSQVGPRALNEAIYMLANGAGKTRAAKDGNMRKPQRWLALVLSSGEMGLADKLAEDGRKARAGQDVRFCGISVEKSHIKELHGLVDAGQLARRVNELCGVNYGHAGRMLIQKMAEPDILANARAKMRGAIEKYASDLCPHGADGQVTRVAMRFAIVANAGILARELGILPKDFAAMNSVKECFEAWLEKRGGAGAAEDSAILAQVRLIIERDGQSRFQDISDLTQNVSNRLGFVKRNDNEVSEHIILPEQFKTEFAKGYSEKRVIQVLRDTGWLEIDAGGKSATRRRLPGMGQRRVYVLRLPSEN